MKKLLSGILAACLSLCLTVPACAAPTPAPTFKSDTGSRISVVLGKTYQFKITSSTGAKPTFTVAGKDFTVKSNGSKGHDYYFVVKAVGKIGDEAGVYINSQKKPSTVMKILAPAVKTDTGSKLTVAKGKTYQFKITSDIAPVVRTGNSSVFQIISQIWQGKSGTCYYVRVEAVGNKGQSTGLYVNGTRVTVCTVG